MKVELPPEIEKFLPDFIVDVGYCDYAISEQVLRCPIARAILIAKAEVAGAVQDHNRLLCHTFLHEADDLAKMIRRMEKTRTVKEPLEEARRPKP